MDNDSNDAENISSKMEKMILSITLGRPAPANESAEDAELRRRLTQNIDDIVKRGYIVDIPFDLP